MILTYEQALSRAAALCSRGEHCAADMRKKAGDWGLTAENAERLVQRLREERFVDDARFVRAFVHDKYEYQHWGCVKIRYALLQKQLPSDLIDEALDEVIGTDDYLDALVELLRTKMRNMTCPLTPKDRARLYRFAAQRGYEMGMIGKALSRLNVPDED